MPSYFPRRIEINLAAPDFFLTTCASDQIQQKESEEVAKSQQQLDERFDSQPGLVEELIYEDDMKTRGLRMINNTPFHLVKADSKDVQKMVILPISAGNTRKLEDVQRDEATTYADLALCVRVQLKPHSFLPRPSSIDFMDIKIDVFLNGEYVASRFVSERIRHNANLREFAQRVSGRRCLRKAEYPWILNIQEDSDSNQNLGVSSRTLARKAHSRWLSVNQRLMESAETCGNDTELAVYLQGLSQVPIPQEIAEAGNESRLPFGIIDVVISEGCGRKYGPAGGYLYGPKPMETVSMLVPEPSNLVTGMADLSPFHAPNLVKSVPPGGSGTSAGSSGDTSTTLKGNAAQKRGNLDAGIEEKLTIGKTSTKKGGGKPRQKGKQVLPPDPDAMAVDSVEVDPGDAAMMPPPPKRIKAVTAPTASMTPAQAINRIRMRTPASPPDNARQIMSSDTGKTADIDKRNTKGVLRPSGQATVPGSPMLRTPDASSPFLDPSSLDTDSLASDTIATMQSQLISGISPVSGPSPPRVQNRGPRTPAGPGDAAAGSPQKPPSRRARAAAQALQAALQNPWQPDEKLDVDGTITYSTDRLRQTRTERNGEFAELGVIYGVRYVVI